jgi:hypothetical protein
MPMPEPFDGYVEHPARVSSTCRVNVQRNCYSVPARLWRGGRGFATTTPSISGALRTLALAAAPITMAPPNPVLPRTTPAIPAIAIAVANGKRPKHPLRGNNHVGAGEADTRIADVRARREEADKLGKRARARSTLAFRIAQRLNQLTIVESRQQDVFVARRRAQRGA